MRDVGKMISDLNTLLKEIDEELGFVPIKDIELKSLYINNVSIKEDLLIDNLETLDIRINNVSVNANVSLHGIQCQNDFYISDTVVRNKYVIINTWNEMKGISNENQ